KLALEERANPAGQLGNGEDTADRRDRFGCRLFRWGFRHSRSELWLRLLERQIEQTAHALTCTAAGCCVESPARSFSEYEILVTARARPVLSSAWSAMP